MADHFATLAREFLALYFPDSVPVFDSEHHFDRLLYEFLSTHHPNVDLTARTVKNLGWSVGMLAPRLPK